MFRQLLVLTVIAMWSDGTVAAEPPTRVRVIGQRSGDALAEWKLHHVDAEPTVQVGQRQGYRVVLRRRYKVFPEDFDQQAPPIQELFHGPFEWRHEDWELVLVPIEGRLPDHVSELADVIDFQERDTGVHLRPVYLGTDHVGEYALYTLASIQQQEQLRDHLNLFGGDDRIQLAVDGLSVEDQGYLPAKTANYMSRILAKFGDAALPYLNRAIEEVENPRRHILALGAIPTRAATRRLIQLYRSGDERKQDAAATALTNRFGGREAAKPVYLDMLRTKRQVPEAARIVANFGWTEAIEPLEQVLADPPSLNGYYAAFRALRKLRGNPFPEEFDQAMRQIEQANSGQQVDHRTLEQGIEKIVGGNDTVAATVAGLELTSVANKADVSAVNAAGREILGRAPQAAVRETLRALSKHLDDADDRRHVEELLKTLD